MNFLFGHRQMLHAVRYYQEFAFPHDFLAVSEAHAQCAFYHQEQLVFLLVMMPNEFALEFHGLHMEIVHFANNARIPIIQELEKFLLKVHRMHEPPPTAYVWP